MADDGKKKRGPKLEFLLNHGDFGSFGFGAKGEPFVPRLYVRYLDENGVPTFIEHGTGTRSRHIDNRELGTALTGMDEIGAFLYETLPLLVNEGVLPEDIEKETVVKLIDDADRNKVRDAHSKALDVLRRTVPLKFGNKSAAINKVLVGVNTASDSDVGKDDTEEDEPLTNFDMMKKLNAQRKELMESPSIKAAMSALKDNGYVLMRKVDDEGNLGPLEWYHNGDEVDYNDIVFGLTGLEDIGLKSRLLGDIERVVSTGDDLNKLAETERAERAIAKKLSSAIKHGDFNPLFGPHTPNYRESAPKTSEDDEGNSMYIPIYVGGENYSPEVLTYPRYDIDILDFDSPFYKGMFGPELIKDDSASEEQRLATRKNKVSDTAKHYKDNAYVFKKGTGKFRKNKEGKDVEIMQTFRGLNPNDALKMPPAYLHRIFDYINKSKEKAFPGYLDLVAGQGEGARKLRDMFEDYMLDLSGNRDKYRKAHEDSIRKFDIKASQPGGNVNVILEHDSEGNVKGMRQISDKEINKKYRNLIRNMLRNDGKYNNRDKYIGIYGKKIIENPELEDILYTDKSLMNMYADSLRAGDPTSSLADTIMESGVNVLKRRLGL